LPLPGYGPSAFLVCLPDWVCYVNIYSCSCMLCLYIRGTITLNYHSVYLLWLACMPSVLLSVYRFFPWRLPGCLSWTHACIPWFPGTVLAAVGGASHVLLPCLMPHLCLLNFLLGTARMQLYPLDCACSYCLCCRLPSYRRNFLPSSPAAENKTCNMPLTLLLAIVPSALPLPLLLRTPYYLPPSYSFCSVHFVLEFRRLHVQCHSTWHAVVISLHGGHSCNTYAHPSMHSTFTYRDGAFGVTV
jgi:hypothetical protein